MWHGDGHALAPFDLLHDDVLPSRGFTFRPLPAARRTHIADCRYKQWHGGGAGIAWKALGPVFCTSVGLSNPPLTYAARFARSPWPGLGEEWTPRELRHSFVSIVSNNIAASIRLAEGSRTHWN